MANRNVAPDQPGAPHGTVAVDHSGRMVFADPEARRLMGLSPSAPLPEQSVRELIHLEGVSGAHNDGEALDGLLGAGEHIVDLPVHIRRRGDGGTSARLDGYPLGNAGERIAAILVLRWLHPDDRERELAGQRLAFPAELVEVIPAPVCVFERTGQLCGWNARLRDAVGRDDAELAASSLRDLFTATPPASVDDVLDRVFRDELLEQGETLRVDAPEGSVRELVVLRGRVGDRPVGLAIAVMGANLGDDAAHARRARTIFESTNEGVMITDPELRILEVNDAFERITGYGREEVLGKTPGILSSGRQKAEFYEAMWDRIRRTGQWQGEIWNRSKSGHVYPEWLTIRVVIDDLERVASYVGIFSDITRMKRDQAQLEHLTHYDTVTGLPNRLLFQSLLDRAIEHAAATERGLVLLLLDLDAFKPVNESLGHRAGDQLLAAIGRRLDGAVRSGDIVARLGSDEFGVLVGDLDGSERAGIVANQLSEAVLEPLEVDGGELRVTASIGVSVYPTDGTEGTTLLRHADVAKDRAKQEGRNTVRFYRAEMTERASEHLNLRSRLQRALEHEELVLHYQPEIELASERLVGVEALVRWNEPEEGLISPGRFLPIAEQTGLIVPLGQWVLRRACRQARAWLDSHLDFGRVAVNVSGVQFRQARFVEEVRDALATSGLSGERLELEITETAFIGDEDPTGPLEELRALGIRLTIDDFGTGYSSLTQLKRLPFDKLKLDKGFVDALPHDEHGVAITRAVLGMGHALGLTVLAEGVEMERQRRFLLDAGCAEGQGFLWDHARDPDTPEQQRWLSPRRS